MTDTIASLFDIKPIQWGLRGDPYLWQEMQTYFQKNPLPTSPDKLTPLVVAAFEQLTGHLFSTSHDFHIQRYSHGGMSSGYISIQFWQEKAIPLLLAQYAKTTPDRTN